uniref:MAT1-1-3 n=1 Tax=Tolypocladium inflatum TaxID=29910 RepID=Q1MVS7_TOLIN|nr:MAT1-1-3 [Tolypocladium inflatum]
MRPRVQVPGPYGDVDTPVTFVTSEIQGNVHVFLPDTYEMVIVEAIAQNFSRRVQQPVKVFHDDWRQKYRLCPLPPGAQAITSTYGPCRFECDMSEPKVAETQATPAASDNSRAHIPRPRNCWILYRQHKSEEYKEKFDNISASELSSAISRDWKAEPDSEKEIWRQKAQEEDRLHKEKYPGYKYTTKKSQGK